MPRFRRPFRQAPQIAFAELPTKEGNTHAQRYVRQFGVVPVAFIAKEGVCPIELMPREVGSRSCKR